MPLWLGHLDYPAQRPPSPYRVTRTQPSGQSGRVRDRKRTASERADGVAPTCTERLWPAGLNLRGARGLVPCDGDVRLTFEELFREHYDEVVRSMRLMVGDHARAEELAQEAFTRACRHWRRVSRLDHPVAWVYVVACNEARRGWRRDQRAASTVVASATQVVEDTDLTIANVLDVRAALVQLTERQRAAVVLRYVADLPLADIADVMGCATGTVKATLHQALAHLRVELEVDNED
jgi:RNA polymerase sigma-70 factor, ECF subfamily